MPVTPTLPNNESNSAGVGANIPENVNVLFSGRYATTVSNYYDNLITWLENSPNKNRFAIVSLDNSNSENQALFAKFTSWGYKYRGNTGSYASWVTSHTNDPVWDYIVKNGPFSNFRLSQQINFNAMFYRDGISGTFDVPTGVTSVLEVAGNGCSLSIDLQRRIIFWGIPSIPILGPLLVMHWLLSPIMSIMVVVYCGRLCGLLFIIRLSMGIIYRCI